MLIIQGQGEGIEVKREFVDRPRFTEVDRSVPFDEQGAKGIIISMTSASRMNKPDSFTRKIDGRFIRGN